MKSLRPVLVYRLNVLLASKRKPGPTITPTWGPEAPHAFGTCSVAWPLLSLELFDLFAVDEVTAFHLNRAEAMIANKVVNRGARHAAHLRGLRLANQRLLDLTRLLLMFCHASTLHPFECPANT